MGSERSIELLVAMNGGSKKLPPFNSDHEKKNKKKELNLFNEFDNFDNDEKERKFKSFKDNLKEETFTLPNGFNYDTPYNHLLDLDEEDKCNSYLKTNDKNDTSQDLFFDDDYNESNENLIINNVNNMGSNAAIDAFIKVNQFNEYSTFINNNEQVKKKIYETDNSYLNNKSDFITSEDEFPSMLSLGRKEDKSQSLPPPISVADNPKENIALKIERKFLDKIPCIVTDSVLHYYNGLYYQLATVDEIYSKIRAEFEDELCNENIISVIKSIEWLVKHNLKLEYKEIKPSNNLYVFLNGTLEAKKRRFRDNSPDDLIFDYLNINYDPNARSMPNINRFLNVITQGDKSLLERVLQVCGYIFSNDLGAEQFFFLYGKTRAGKSKLCDLITSFFEPSFYTSRLAKNIGDRFAPKNLYNARIFLAHELSHKPLTSDIIDLIKAITGRDMIPIEEKYVIPFKARLKCKMIITGNNPIQTNEPDNEALIERMVVLPFSYTIPQNEREPDILHKMLPERAALFNYALEAYEKLKACNYIWAGGDSKFGGFYEKVLLPSPDEIVIEFVQAKCIFNESSITFTTDLKQAYERFCIEKAYPSVKGDEFSKILNRVYINKITPYQNKQRGYKGIALKT